MMRRLAQEATACSASSRVLVNGKIAPRLPMSRTRLASHGWFTGTRVTGTARTPGRR
jgi:hypothetical protein